VVPPCSDRISRVPPYSRTHRTGRIRGCHPLRPAFPDHSAYIRQATGLIRFRSPLLAESLLMSFPPGTEMFQFPGFASSTYVFSERYPLPGGLPHSDIHGSKPARGSPWLFAACHVLHRLLVPRHPPNALLMLDHQTRPITGSSPEPTLHRNHPHTRNTRASQSTDTPHTAGRNRAYTHLLGTRRTSIRPTPTPLNASPHKRAANPTLEPRPTGQSPEARPLAGQTSPMRRAQRRTRTRFTVPKTTRPAIAGRHTGVATAHPAPQPCGQRFAEQDRTTPNPIFSVTTLRTAKATGLRSNHHQTLVEAIGVEPTTPCLQSRCSTS
jgi:hypothetical protein